MSRSDEIRGGAMLRLIGWCIGWLCRIWGWTYRLEVTDRANVTDLSRTEPVVFLVWHNRLFTLVPLWKRTCKHFPPVALMSASRDGSILEAAVKTAGVEVARGSSSRRGAAALVVLRKSLRAKKDVYITPDGPRGPKYKLKSGGLKLAQAEQVAVVPMRIKMLDYWQLRSWDAFRIPKPFSVMHLYYEEAIFIPKELSEEEFEALRLKIENQLCKNDELYDED
jgi:lysophospholipid acyltransferase (LPLAT)-like uncharacterized protein